MRLILFAAVAACVAHPALASADRTSMTLISMPAVDWLYPEVDVDDEGFRGLLPVILLDTENVVQSAPVAAGESQRSN